MKIDEAKDEDKDKDEDINTDDEETDKDDKKDDDDKDEDKDKDDDKEKDDKDKDADKDKDDDKEKEDKDKDADKDKDDDKDKTDEKTDAEDTKEKEPEEVNAYEPLDSADSSDLNYYDPVMRTYFSVTPLTQSMIDETQDPKNDKEVDYNVRAKNNFLPLKLKIISDCEDADLALPNLEQYLYAYYFEDPNLIEGDIYAPIQCLTKERKVDRMDTKPDLVLNTTA
jgi:hypothetical protein